MMQTFVPYGVDFVANAASLDVKRLGKQRVEAYQILRTLTGVSTGWRHHPAVRMWIGYEHSLAVYGIQMCAEWMHRGYSDTLVEKIAATVRAFDGPTNGLPAWLRDPNVTMSHRCNLVRKLPEWYGPMWPDVDIEAPYVWPVSPFDPRA